MVVTNIPEASVNGQRRIRRQYPRARKAECAPPAHPHTQTNQPPAHARPANSSLTCCSVLCTATKRYDELPINGSGEIRNSEVTTLWTTMEANWEIGKRGFQ